MEQIYCNKCGKVIEISNGIPREDFIRICKEWGYFSKKDGTTQEFVLCEDCVERMEEEFILPVSFRRTTEMI
ncbi:MAG: hypothetical protein NC300_08720 [Bacteroidales bacterium]|nr:hypothetical protein [Clostridium sp.]MCM1204214.1 hypothetical protein [Bacteroidales bacterium]